MSSFSDDDDEEDERENTATELPRCSSLVCKDDDDDEEEEDVDDIELTSESLLVWSFEYEWAAGVCLFLLLVSYNCLT